MPNLDETVFAVIPGAARVGRLLGRFEGLVRGDGNKVIRPTQAAPRTSFNGKVTAHRRFVFGQLPLDRVKALKKAHGVTVNDVIVALCAGAVRQWLIVHDELPAEPLVAQVPVSVRTTEEAGTYGNRILMLAAALHTEIADPIERLMQTSADLTVMKDRHKALPAQLLSDANNFIPPALSTGRRGSRSRWAAPRSATRRGTSSCPTCPARNSTCTARERSCSPTTPSPSSPTASG